MRPIRHLLALPLLLVLAAQAPERVVERKRSNAVADRGVAVLRAAMIEGHAKARQAVGTPPLAWDETLAGHALAYAQEMARTGRFVHSAQPIGPAREGENLWTGTRGDYTFAEMIGHWAAEKRNFVNLPSPGFSRTGRWQDVTHYAQMIWRGSTRFGCAIASNAREDFVVCRYSPSGNVIGQRAY